MKLIIDIPQQIYEIVVNTGKFGCYRFDTRKAIRNGISLDKIRAEIAMKKQKIDFKGLGDYEKAQVEMRLSTLNEILQIIDKYKESED